MPEFTLIDYTLLFIVAYFAESYWSIVWWQSFVVQPYLIAMWLPPHMAVANEVSATSWSDIWSSTYFQKKKLIRWEIIIWVIPGLLLWTFFWVYLLNIVSAEFIEKFIAILAVCMVIYTLFFKKISWTIERKLPKNHKFFLILFWIFIWVYMWFSGAWTGVIGTFILVSFFWTTFLQSLWTRKVIHFIPRVLASIWYLYFGLLHLGIFITIFFASMLWGLTGSKLAMIIWDRWLRPLFIVVVLGFSFYMLVK